MTNKRTAFRSYFLLRYKTSTKIRLLPPIEFRTATRTKKGIYTAMITNWGVLANQYSQAIVANNLTMSCLFQ